MSWDDVAADLGDAKIGFMTGENAWTTMLVYSSLIAAEPGGADLLLNGVTEKIMDFNQKPIIDATAKLQKLMQENSTASAVGAAYADAANQFFSNKAAIFPNGSWMVSDFAPESSDKWSNGFDAGEDPRRGAARQRGAGESARLLLLDPGDGFGRGSGSRAGAA